MHAFQVFSHPWVLREEVRLEGGLLLTRIRAPPKTGRARQGWALQTAAGQPQAPARRLPPPRVAAARMTQAAWQSAARRLRAPTIPHRRRGRQRAARPRRPLCRRCRGSCSAAAPATRSRPWRCRTPCAAQRPGRMPPATRRALPSIHVAAPHLPVDTCTAVRCGDIKWRLCMLAGRQRHPAAIGSGAARRSIRMQTLLRRTMKQNSTSCCTRATSS